MKKNIILLSTLIGVLSIFIVSYIIFKSNKKPDEFNFSGSLAIMVDSTGSGSYVQQASIPTGKFTLNTTMSRCESGASIGAYNNTAGTVTISTLGQDRCYLYFKKLNEITITYNNNGGSGCSSKIIDSGGAIGSMCTPTQTGKDFTGWFTAASGGNQVTTATTFSANTTIYAHWVTSKLNIIYNLAGGTGCSNTTHDYGTAINLCTPTRSNYFFKGWYTASGCSGTKYTKSPTTSNITLYACWSTTS